MEKKIVCILGMHRCGSSYVAGRIRGMGIDFGCDNDLIAGDTYNERGYNENKDLSYLGEEILIAMGGDHIRPPFLESGWENSPSLDSFRVKAKQLIDTKFKKSPAWGWKDPRNSLLLPFWKQVVDPTHYVIAVRNPLEVAESLLQRNGIAVRHGSELWFLHLAAAVFHTRGLKRKFVFFEDACQSPLHVDRQLAEFLSVNDTDFSVSTDGPEFAFADSLVHHRQSDDQLYSNPDIHPLTKALYHALRELPRSKDGSDTEILQAIDDAPKYEELSIAHIVEAEPSLLINPWTLSHCLVRKPSSECSGAEHNEQVANLQTIVAECKEQLSSLNHTLQEYSRQTHELITVNNRLRHETEAVSVRQQGILQSNSWKFTAPLREFSRIASYRFPLRSSKQLLYRLMRTAGRKLPVSQKVKITCRNALLEFAYPDQDLPAPPIELPAEKAGQENAVMRPGYCGLEAGLVSIVLPVYNQASLLAESIESVLAQTYKRFELIVINDGSTDSVETVLERYADNPKVRVYTQHNQKLPKALTNGFTYARGEYWTWTSADNLMEPMMLELMVQKLRLQPSVGMVYADYVAIDDRGELLKDPVWRAHNRPSPTTGEVRLPRSVRTLNTVQDNFIGPCFMYRGWIGRCLGEYDSELGVEDYDYWMRINAFFTIAHLGKEACLYRYRVHDNSLSANAHEHGIFEKVRALMDYEKERAKLYATPVTYVADSVGFDWLTSCGIYRRDIRNIEDANNPSVLKSALIVIGINTLEKYPGVFCEIEITLAVIFDDEAADYVKLKYLRSDRVAVLACNERVAPRVSLVADFPVFDAASAQAFNAVFAFHKNKCFFNSTRKAVERYRSPPKKQFSNKSYSRILLQVDSFTQGGMENVVIDLALCLKELGNDVSIAILGKEGDAAVKAREQGIAVTSFGGPPTEEAYEAYLKTNKVGLVNAHFSVYGAKIFAGLDIPFLQTIHNSYVWLEPKLATSYRSMDPYVTAYICVSATAARYADVVLGLDVAKMKVISNGIDPNSVDHMKFKPNRENQRRIWRAGSKSPVFLNVASIMAPKAQLALVNAFSEVLRIKQSARLVLVGSAMEPAYQREIERRVATLGIQESVIIAGYDRSVAKYYHAADVFVLPSYWEGWSLSLGEAMANGLPCVITDVGSSYEFYGHERIEIIKPPFGDITRLNYLNLGNYVYGRNAEFEKRLADAMIRAADKPRVGIDEPLRQNLDRITAYKAYASFFSEIRALKKDTAAFTDQQRS